MPEDVNEMLTPEGEVRKTPTFLEIQKELGKEGVSEDRKQELKNQRQKLVDEAAEAGVFDEARFSVTSLLKQSNWDEVYPRILGIARELENNQQGYLDFKPEWKGMVQTVVEGAAAEVAVSGLNQKTEQGGASEDWAKRHGYNERVIQRLEKTVEDKYIHPILPDSPELLVGSSLGEEAHKQTDPVVENLIEVISEGQKDLMSSLNQQRITLEQFLQLSGRQSQELVNALSKQSLEEERERWVDVEFRRDFYTRFQPNMEPRFYTELVAEDIKEKPLWDARWQVARAAYFKLATASSPEKYIENKDLELLSREQLERLYKMPGVRQMLESYAQVFTNGKTASITRENKETGELEKVVVTFWDLKSMTEFYEFREELREELVLNSEFQKNLEEQKKKRKRGGEVTPTLAAQEADAVAFNLMWIFNQPESSNSFYSHAGKTVGLPGAINSADFRGAHHQNERFFGKTLSKQNWGVFSTWGIAQVKRIEEESSFKKENGDKFEYKPAERGKFWSWKRVGKIVTVEVPECYPVAACGGFLEEITLEQSDGTQRPLLDYLVNGEEIDWNSVSEDAVAFWLFSKFNKAVQLQEYFNPGKPFERDKFGWAKAWAGRLVEILEARLDFEKIQGNLADKGITSYQNMHNLKVWAVFAAHGGVAHPEKKEPTLNLPGGILSVDRPILVGALKDSNVRFFEKNERLIFK